VKCFLRGLEPYSYCVRIVNHSLSQESFELPAPQRAMLRRSVVFLRESPNLQLVLGRNQYRYLCFNKRPVKVPPASVAFVGAT